MRVAKVCGVTRPRSLWCLSGADGALAFVQGWRSREGPVRARCFSCRRSGEALPLPRCSTRPRPGASGSALPLLVARVVADHHHTTVPADDLALVADLLDARLNLHSSNLFNRRLGARTRPILWWMSLVEAAGHASLSGHRRPTHHSTRRGRRLPKRVPRPQPPVPTGRPDNEKGRRRVRRCPSQLECATSAPLTCDGRRYGPVSGRTETTPRRRGPRAGCGCSAGASCR